MSRTNDPGTAPESMGGKAGQLGDNLREIGGQVRDAAREQYERMREQATDYYETGKEKAQEWQENVEDYVREKPMRALLIAAGAGVLIGLLMRRR